MGSGGVMMLALFLVTVFWAGAMAQSNCTNVLIGMAPCLNYVTGSSKTPTSACCASLANVVQSQPQCLCTALNGSAMAALGVNINQTLALALPGACNVQTPPVSRCNAGTNARVMAPVGSPESSPEASTGSKQVPGNGVTSDASGTTIITNTILACVLFILASLPSAYSNF